MFEMSAVSSPGAATFPDRPMWLGEMASLTKYDENLIKPAVLFADTIHLYSDRLDMMAMAKSDFLRVGTMPLRTIYNYVGVSARAEPEELQCLGVDAGVLARPEDLVPFWSSDDSPDFEQVHTFAATYESQIEEVRQASLRLYAARLHDLQSAPLKALADEGILTESGWAAGEDDAWSLAWTDPDEFFVRIVDDLVRSSSQWGDAVLLEPGTRMLLTKKDQAKIGVPVGISAPLLAASLIGRLPGVQEVEISELIEIRGDLAAYLVPFRAEVLNLAAEVASDASRDAGTTMVAVDRLWHAKVNPILAELEAKVRKGGYPRQLLNAFGDDTQSLAASGASVVLATGSIYAGIGVLLPAAAAATVPFVRALKATLAARDDIRENRMYFLYEARRRVGAAKRRS